MADEKAVGTAVEWTWGTDRVCTDIRDLRRRWQEHTQSETPHEEICAGCPAAIGSSRKGKGKCTGHNDSGWRTHCNAADVIAQTLGWIPDAGGDGK